MAALPVSDADLLARHVAGDREAFGELVSRHRDRLWAVALRTLGNSEDAADALQEALLSAYRHADSFRGSAAVTTWLHRIVVNACLDLARRQAARPATSLPDPPDLVARDALGDRELQDAVLAALRSIAPEQAAAVVLVDIEGFSVREAADILEVPDGTVKSRCARGRSRLAQLLDGSGQAAVNDGGTASAAAASYPVNYLSGVVAPTDTHGEGQS